MANIKSRDYARKVGKLKDMIQESKDNQTLVAISGSDSLIKQRQKFFIDEIDWKDILLGYEVAEMIKEENLILGYIDKVTGELIINDLSRLLTFEEEEKFRKWKGEERDDSNT